MFPGCRWTEKEGKEKAELGGSSSKTSIKDKALSNFVFHAGLQAKNAPFLPEEGGGKNADYA